MDLTIKLDVIPQCAEDDVKIEATKKTINCIIRQESFRRALDLFVQEYINKTIIT